MVMEEMTLSGNSKYGAEGEMVKEWEREEVEEVNSSGLVGTNERKNKPTQRDQKDRRVYAFAVNSSSSDRFNTTGPLGIKYSPPLLALLHCSRALRQLSQQNKSRLTKHQTSL